MKKHLLSLVSSVCALLFASSAFAAENVYTISHTATGTTIPNVSACTYTNDSTGDSYVGTTDNWWHHFCRGQNAYNTAKPGYVVHFATGSLASTQSDGYHQYKIEFSPFSVGGIIVDADAGLSKFYNTGTRKLEFGNSGYSSYVCENTFNETFMFSAEDPQTYLYGTVVFDIASGKKFIISDTNSDVSYTVGSGATIKMKGAGQWELDGTLPLSGKTLDLTEYTAFGSDDAAVAPFIGKVSLDQDSVIKLPVGAQAGVAYKLFELPSGVTFDATSFNTTNLSVGGVAPESDTGVTELVVTLGADGTLTYNFAGRNNTTIVWNNTQTTWSADTDWTIDGTETTTKFQEGDTIVFDLTEDKEITFNGSFKPEAIVVKGAKLTIKASGQTTTVHTSTTLADGGSLDVSDTGGSTYLAAVDVGEGCTLFANLDQMPGGISGSGKWCYNTSDSVTYASGMANLTIWVKKGNTFQAQQNANASLPASLSLELEGGARFYFPAGGTIASPIKVLSSATLENPAQLDGSYYGGTTPLTGAITLDGTLKLITGTTNCGNAYNISGAITGPGGLIVDDSQSQLVELTGVNTFTGGLTVNRNVTIDHDAVGRGDITVTAETLTVTNGGTLTILSGKTLAGAGTIAGNVEFADGAILDASQVLSVTGVSSVGTAKIKLAEAPADGTTAVKVLSATSVELPFAATIVYGEAEMELTGWVTTSESDGLYIIKADTIKETTLTPPAEGELTWAGAWGENAPGESESATLIVTQDITLDIGTTELPVGAVTIKKGETATTTPTLTLVNVANFAPSGILLEGVNLAFAGTTEADATTMITYPIMGAGSVTVTGGTVSLANAGNTFDGGVTIASGATVYAGTAVDDNATLGTGAVTVAGKLIANAYDCLQHCGTVTVKAGGVLEDNGASHNTLRHAQVTLEGGAVMNVKFATAFSNTSNADASAVISGTGTVICTALPRYINDACFKDNTNWQGLFCLKDVSNSGQNAQAIAPNAWGNANSTVELDSVTGWIAQNTTFIPTIKLSGEGFTLNNGSSGTDYYCAWTFNKLIGDGPLNGPINLTWGCRWLIPDTSAFEGDIILNTTPATPKDTRASVVIGSDTAAAEKKKIVVAENVTGYIALGKTWSASDGVVVKGTLVLTAGEGLSTIDGALTGSGTVKIGEGRSLKVTGTVADTVNFTTEVEGKVVAKTTDDTGTTCSLAEPKANVASEGELRTALAKDYITTITATGSFEIAGELTLAEGKTFVIPDGKTVTAKATATVYIQGVISVKGTLDGSAIPYSNPGLVPSQGGYVEIGANGHVIMPSAWASAGLNPTNMSVVGTCEEGATITFVDAAVWNYTDGAWVKEAPAIVPPKPATGGTVVIEAADADTAQEIVNGLTIEPITVDGTTILLKATLEGDGTEGNPFTAQLAFADEAAAAEVLTPEVGAAEDSTAEPIAITADGVQLTIAKSVEGLWYGYKTGATLAEVMAAKINTDVAFTKGNGQELTLPKVTDAKFFKVVVLPYNPNK